MKHDEEELHNLAYNVIRDIEDAADIDRMVKLIERAMRHYAEYMDKSDVVEELKRYISDDALAYVTRAGERLDQEKAKVVELTERIATLEAENRRLDAAVMRGAV